MTASGDDTAKIWDVASGEELQTLTGHGDRVVSAVYSPDGSQVVTASDDGTAKIWDVASGEELQTLTGHGDCGQVCGLQSGWEPGGDGE